MMVMIPIRVREAREVRSQNPETAEHKVALDSEHNVVVVPDKEEPDIVVRLRDALIAEWKYAPQ